MEVTNQILGTLLRTLIKPHSKAWDLMLSRAEFAYNKASSKATRISPFKVVDGIDPLGPLDLVPRPLDQNPVQMPGKGWRKSKGYMNLHEKE